MNPHQAKVWVRSGVLVGLPELLEELGGDLESLAGQAGFDMEALQQPDLPVPGLAVVRMYEGAADVCRCEDFGIRLASLQNLSVLGPLWMTMRSARTVRDALQVLAEYFVIHTSGAMIGLEHQPDGGLCLTYNLAAGVSPRDRQTIELGLALLCNEMRSHAGAGWVPRAVQLCHDRPASMESHRRCFGPNLSFNQDRNALWVDPDCLATPLAAASLPTHAMLRRLLVSRRDSAKAVVVKVESTMRALLPFSACSRQHVATLVGLSERSLQRRLAEAGTSFQALRDGVRADIAMKYLSQSNLQAAQVGEILGYAEPAVFTRAFKRQHGITPREARRRVQRGAAPA